MHFPQLTGEGTGAHDRNQVAQGLALKKEITNIQNNSPTSHTSNNTKYYLRHSTFCIRKQKAPYLKIQVNLVQDRDRKPGGEESFLSLWLGLSVAERVQVFRV